VQDIVVFGDHFSPFEFEAKALNAFKLLPLVKNKHKFDQWLQTLAEVEKAAVEKAAAEQAAAEKAAAEKAAAEKAAAEKAAVEAEAILEVTASPVSQDGQDGTSTAAVVSAQVKPGDR
jgi:membrane protein involved in colicin uptake